MLSDRSSEDQLAKAKVAQPLQSGFSTVSEQWAIRDYDVFVADLGENGAFTSLLL